jgi:hypothetical protein
LYLLTYFSYRIPIIIRPSNTIERDMEENFIKEILNLRNGIARTNETDLSVKDNCMQKPEKLALEDIFDYLSLNLVEDQSTLYLLIFVAAVENNETVVKLIKEKTDNFEGYDNPETNKDDLVGILTGDPRILENSFSLAIKFKSLVMVKYILEGAADYFLYP